MKVEKGVPGYIKSQQRIRTVCTVLLLAAVLLIYGTGLKLNGGSRQSIFSILAALCCIPFAMSGVGMVMMWMRRPVREELIRTVGEKGSAFLVLYELYVTTREHSLFLDAAAIRGTTVIAYTEDSKASVHMAEVRLHLQRALGLVSNDAEVQILCSQEAFLAALEDGARDISDDPEMQEAFAETLKALSL